MAGLILVKMKTCFIPVLSRHICIDISQIFWLDFLSQSKVTFLKLR